MKQELSNLANFLNLDAGCDFTEATLLDSFPSILTFLRKTGTIVPASPAKQVLCRDCDRGHYEYPVEIENRYFIKCGYSEYATLTEVARDELMCSRFSLQIFLSWLAAELGMQGRAVQAEAKVWHLGKFNNNSLFFIQSLALDETLGLIKTVNTANNLFIWLGTKPLTRVLVPSLVSVQDILTIKNGQLNVLLNVIEPRRATPAKDGIPLDKDIILAHDNRLLLTENMGTYDVAEKITPQTYCIVRWLYDVRKYGKAYTSKEIAVALHLPNPKVIPTRIKVLNKKCADNRVKELVVAYPDHKWALNPDLTCRK